MMEVVDPVERVLTIRLLPEGGMNGIAQHRNCSSARGRHYIEWVLN
jgi:hypothetical protein